MDVRDRTLEGVGECLGAGSRLSLGYFSSVPLNLCVISAVPVSCWRLVLLPAASAIDSKSLRPGDPRVERVAVLQASGFAVRDLRQDYSHDQGFGGGVK